MHEVLVNRLGGLRLPKKSVVRLTDRPDMTPDVCRGRKTTTQQLIRELSVSCDDSLVGKETFMRTICFEPLRKQRARFGPSKACLKPSPNPSNLILTIPRRYFCCGSSMLHVVMSVCIWSPAIRSAE